jgi:hypothetical protein
MDLLRTIWDLWDDLTTPLLVVLAVYAVIREPELRVLIGSAAAAFAGVWLVVLAVGLTG